MSHKNDFKAFSISNNANVVSQEKYEQNQSLQTGFPPDSVSTHLLNKVLRQTSTISSVVADFIATQSGNDVLDDGNIAKLTTQLNKALEQKIKTDIPSASLTQKGTVQLTNVIGNSDTLAVTQKLIQEVISSLRDYTREEIDNRIKMASEVPVGSPIPWPLSHPPIGYFTCNGSAFNKLQYPKLAEAYPDGRLPDLRGEFIRGWDDGRGIDIGRNLLSAQADAFKRHNHSISTTNSQSQTLENTDPVRGSMTGGASYRGGLGEGKSIGMSGENETRPRNIAFSYIVRAA
ncbi:tail fiber protein [Photorhabdus asymbiotica]|uniref:tail fiber protein n=1 Tax=Photorhabdus asymbiotica TaxID=291112 RepID=UPI003DA6E9FF